MRLLTTSSLVIFVAGFAGMSWTAEQVGQAQAQEGGRGRGQAPLPVPTNLVASGIAGVVAAGTPIQLIKTGFQGAEGPVGMADGSVLFTETGASRITRIDPAGNISTFLENSNQSNGLAFDLKGRLISVQRAPGNQKVGVLYPKGSEAVLADNYDGKPFNRLNDIVVDRKGGVYFSDSIGDNTGLYYIPHRWEGRSDLQRDHESERYAAEP